MDIYEARTSMTTASGSVATTTLHIGGGLLRNLLVRANTDSTLFRTDITDDNGVLRRNFGYHKGELNADVQHPVQNVLTLNITNATPDDTFRIIATVEV